MSNVVAPKIFAGGVVSADQVARLHALDQAIFTALGDAKTAGVPKGLVVAILHGYALAETHAMLEAAPRLT